MAEPDVHPHAQKERAHLFHASDMASAELEVLNFLNALIYLYKPEIVLETGTHRGLSAIAIASALKVNGAGKLHTIEWVPTLVEVARGNLEKYDVDLLDYVEMHCAESTEWLSRYSGAPFDFAFFDSSLDSRYAEFEILKRDGRFSSQALVMFHDTSSYRGEYFDDYKKEMLVALDTAASDRQRLSFHLSRGFVLFSVF